MKVRNIVLLIMFCCVTYCTNGQQVVQRFYENVIPGSLIKVTNGNLYLSGTFAAPSTMPSTLGFVSELDSVGHSILAIGYHDSLNNYRYGITKSKQITNGSFIHILNTMDTLNNYSQAILTTNTSGTIKSSKMFQYPYDAGVIDFAEDKDGHIVFVGNIDHGYVSSYNDRRCLIFKTDSNLNLLWSKEYQGFVDCGLKSIDVFRDGSYLLQGDYFDTTAFLGNTLGFGRLDVCVFKTDTSGNILWARQPGNPNSPIPGGINSAVAQPCKALVADDETIINGFSCDWYANQFSGYKGDIIIQRLDSNGNEISCHRYGDQTYGVERLNDIFEDSNGNIVFSSGQLLFKCNYILNKEWIKYARPNLINSNNFLGFFGFNERISNVYQAIARCQIGPPYKSLGCFVNTDSSGVSGCNNQNISFFFDQSETPGTFDIINRFSINSLIVSNTNINVNSMPILISDSIDCNSNTTISDNLNDTDIRLFPNPVVDNIRIEGIRNDCEFTVLTMDYKLLRKGMLVQSNSYNLNLANLKTGFYILSIMVNSRCYNFKILKI